MLNIDAFRHIPLSTEPYEHVIVPDFLAPGALEAINADFPDVPGPGSHPPSALTIGPTFQKLLDEMDGPAFREAVEEKFGLDLSQRPTMYTVRGFCRAKDGKIHTDTESKIITVLLYLNDRSWDSSGGRLRLLRSGTDLEDYATEIEPKGGTLLVFRRSDRSWHGHHSYEGPRRAIQMNWVDSNWTRMTEQMRHKLSTVRKRVGL
ncbi:MAG TPA: 2OG-Fe(II) oxygenase [Devosiaceae bacterium]